jgi:REP element-mobilizing transposase RayT
MSRPLRIEFPGAVYHVTSRGDMREPIYRDDADRLLQLDVLATALDRFDAQVLAYCQMGNHYHLVLNTRQGNLSRLMRHLNGVYTQGFNRRHGLVGHLFQGRFKAILVDRDAYLLALCRYVERNPVAARLVQVPDAWPWSSCQAHLGQVPTPPWLDSQGLYGHLLGQAPRTLAQQRRAQALYADLVGQAQTGDDSFWTSALRGQIYLGDETFVDRMRAKAGAEVLQAKAVPRMQRSSAKTWAQCLELCNGDRDQALVLAYREGGLTMTALAATLGLSVTHISRLIAARKMAGGT